MSTLIGIGYSKSPHPIQAAKEAAMMAKSQIHSSHTHLLLIFGTMGYQNQDVIQTIQPILQPDVIIGSSTSGVILPEMILNKGLGIAAISASENIHCYPVKEHDFEGRNTYFVGQQIGEALIQKTQGVSRNGLLYFSDPSFKNQSGLIAGIQETIGGGIPLLGGVSSDQFVFDRSFQIYNNQMPSHSVVSAIISGQTTIATGMKHGWHPLGKPRIVTSSSDNLIHTIDDRPAIDIYNEFFGDEAKNAYSTTFSSMTLLYPLGIYSEIQENYLLRTPIEVMDNGSIVCQGDIPQGAEIHIMIGNKDSLRQAARDVASQVRENLYGKQAKLVIMMISAIRQRLFGRSAFQEIQLMKDILGYTTPIIGMYSYGEIVPMQSPNDIRQVHFLNGSISLMAIG